MKKILFSAYSLDVGGIETALVTLINYLAPKYEITLALEKKQGIFLDMIPNNVKIITYTPSNNKIVIIRKITNFIKQLKFKSKYKNKFDFSACYTTYSLPSSFIARCASKNSALWIHNNYMDFYNQDIIEYKRFFQKLKVEDFNKIILVSNLNRIQFISCFPYLSKKSIMCHNLIDYQTILKKSELQNEDMQKILKSKRENETIFVHVGRHDEQSKKITRIISATRKLNKEGYKFKVLLVGKGQDTREYRNRAKDLKNILFMGLQKNPYPYIKNSDCLILSSETEGYPVVLQEALTLGTPIISTDVSDVKSDFSNKYGIIVENSEKGVYSGMKEFLNKRFIPEEFSPKKYNEEIIKRIERIINGH